jgi:hypothetical protein
VKRMGELDAVAHEFAREHSDRLWKQLVAPEGESRPAAQRDAWVALCLTAAAAAAVKLPLLFGLTFDADEGFYARNASLFALPFLTAYFAWKRDLDVSAVRWLLVGFIVAAALANTFQFAPRSHTEALSALHLPIALWLLVGLAYAGNRWSQVAGRMDFIRFSGELFIYFVLIGLGGGVLMAFTAMIFSSIGMNPEHFFQNWLAPCGAAGGVVIAAWLVEAKQSVIENMAPVLTRLFTPLFAAVLIDRIRPDPRAGAGPAAVLGFGPRSRGRTRSARRAAGDPRGERVAGGRRCTMGDCGSHQRVRLHAEPHRCARREPDPAGEPRVVRGALPTVPPQTARVRGPRTLADELPSGLRGLGRDRRDRVPALVWLKIIEFN